MKAAETAAIAELRADLDSLRRDFEAERKTHCRQCRDAAFNKKLRATQAKAHARRQAEEAAAAEAAAKAKAARDAAYAQALQAPRIKVALVPDGPLSFCGPPIQMDLSRGPFFIVFDRDEWLATVNEHEQVAKMIDRGALTFTGVD